MAVTSPQTRFKRENTKINDMDLGQAIKILRQKQGLTQGQLAERCGMNDQTISDWETGKPLCESVRGDRVTLKALAFLPNSSRNTPFDAEGAPVRDALLIGDTEREDSEGKYGTHYIPLLSAEELIQEADRVLGGYRPPEEVLERYGIM